MMDLYEELEKIKVELGITQKVYCSKDEEEEFEQLKKANQPLPENVEVDNMGGLHFRYVKTDMSNEEIKELFLYRQTKYLESIKNSMIFFVILTLVSLIFSIFIGLR